MDLSCIIESGDLELYVLGMLPEEEAYKVAQLASLFPEIEHEITEIAASLLQLSSSAAVVPSAEAKTGLMSRLKSMKVSEDSAGNVATAVEKKGSVGARIIALPRRRNNAFFTASMIGLLIGIGSILYLASTNRQAQTQKAQMQQQLNDLRNNDVRQKEQLEAYNQTLQMVYSDVFRKIQLTNVPGKPEAKADIFWNTQTKDVFVADITLPKAPSDKQYQLWAIVNGKPVSAGLLNGSKMQIQKMKAFETADAFAITLEDKGGSPSPTMEAMYVMAKA